MARVWLGWLVVGALAGCGDASEEGGAGSDVGSDAGDVGQDAGGDAGDDDVSDDAGEDVGDDAGEDAGDDAGEDVGDDVGDDVGEDAGDDAGEDVSEDAGDDAGEDAGDVGEAEACPEGFVEAIRACAEGWLADAEGEGGTVPELVASCADAEPLAATLDELCAAEPGAEFCVGVEAFYARYGRVCQAATLEAMRPEACVFGGVFRDLWLGPHTVVTHERWIRSVEGLSALEGRQVVRAVQASSHTDVETPEEALSRVDGQELRVLSVYDVSSERAYTVYEYGAGDSSYGLAFVEGSLAAVARIGDGDWYDCFVGAGPIGAACLTTDECAQGLFCAGTLPPEAEATGHGRCIGTQDREGEGSRCTQEAPCLSGLVCGLVTVAEEGLCLPAWQRRAFVVEKFEEIPDADAEGLDVPIVVSGLATVSLDVELELWVSHPRPQDLRVTLTNAAGTTTELEADELSSLFYRRGPVRGLPSDESIQGVWHLRFYDEVSGEVGTVDRVVLTITSQWD